MTVEELVDENRAVTEFVRLAQQTLKSDPPRKADLGFARVQARIAAKQEARGVPRLVWVSACAAAVTLFAAGGWMFSAQRPLTYEVVNGQVSSDGSLLAGDATRIQFSDGSRVVLEPGAKTKLEELTARGGLVRVDSGAVHVAIAKKPGAEWSIHAGPYAVRVTGTAFDVRWSASAQRFELLMQSGSVVVSGPLAPQGVSLRAGQSMVADKKLVVEDGRNAALAAAEAPEQEPPKVSEAAVADLSFDDLPMLEPLEPPNTKKADPGKPLSWRDHVARGSFRTVLDEAERRGLDRTLASANLADLSALADAARYGRRNDLARRTLLAQRQRFAGSFPAKEAAFFLGSLSESRASALEWYDRYLQESPTGPYASQSLGRKLIIVYEQQRAAEARQLAEQYKARYPNGPYASTARKVLAEAQASDSTSASSRARSGR